MGESIDRLRDKVGEAEEVVGLAVSKVKGYLGKRGEKIVAVEGYKRQYVPEDIGFHGTPGDPGTNSNVGGESKGKVYPEGSHPSRATEKDKAIGRRAREIGDQAHAMMKLPEPVDPAKSKRTILGDDRDVGQRFTDFERELRNKYGIYAGRDLDLDAPYITAKERREYLKLQRASNAGLRARGIDPGTNSNVAGESKGRMTGSPKPMSARVRELRNDQVSSKTRNAAGSRALKKLNKQADKTAGKTGFLGHDPDGNEIHSGSSVSITGGPDAGLRGTVVRSGRYGQVIVKVGIGVNARNVVVTHNEVKSSGKPKR